MTASGKYRRTRHFVLMTILQRAAGRRSPVLRRPRRGAVPPRRFVLEVDGVPVESSKFTRTRIAYIASAEGADGFFSLEEREEAENVLAAAKRPFRDFADLPSAVSATLVRLVEEAGDLQPESEVHLMSAFWNSIWAICNLHRCFGEIVESVGIEQDEFVALVLKPLEGSEARGKLLVGPRGTYAYVVGRGDDERYGYGGEETQLFVFPDQATRDTFEEFGWSAVADGGSGEVKSPTYRYGTVR